jgi:F-type H+-transporting ATPase subunit delta
MKTGKQTRREAKELFRSCLANGLLDDNRVRQVVSRLLEARPRGYMDVLGHFKRLIKLDLDRRTARVESAVPLDAEQQTRVRSGLDRQYGPGLSISFAQNTALIGGMRVKVGSDVYDGSVQARLNALREEF